MLAKVSLQAGRGLRRSQNSIHTTTAASWSFVSSPESATGSIPIQEYLPKQERSRTLSSQITEKKNPSEQHLKQRQDSIDIATATSWSFVSSPESATGSVSIQEYLPKHIWSHLLSSQTVEKKDINEQQSKLSNLQEAPAFTNLDISSPETAIGSAPLNEFLDYQHQLLYYHSKDGVDPQPLPQTLQDALGNENDSRAIVVTEAYAPFDIIDVNNAWVNMCGFSREEARNRSLAMIQGPETKKGDLKDMINDLREGNETSALITNYTKSGRKFYNYVRAGPVIDAQNHITHFVGILQELTEPPNEFRVAL